VIQFETRATDELNAPFFRLGSMAHLPEDEWIRYRIEQLRRLRRSVTDAPAVRAIDELIYEAEERVRALEAVRPDPSS